MEQVLQPLLADENRLAVPLAIASVPEQITVRPFVGAVSAAPHLYLSDRPEWMSSWQWRQRLKPQKILCGVITTLGAERLVVRVRS